MKYYEFDQEGLGKFMESNSRSNRTSESRVDDIRQAVKRSLIVEIIFGVITFIMEATMYYNLTYAPVYVAIIWAYIWCVTTLRSYFGITGMWKIGILKEERIMAFRKMGLLWGIHTIILVVILVNFCVYLEEIPFGLLMFVISIILTAISYTLGYATGSQKQRRWWEFSNYNEWHS